MHTGAMGKCYSLDCRGKFGYSGRFGRIAFGYTRLGFYNWYCGIYQKKYYFGKPYLSRMKFYRPTNNQKPQQQLWRGQIRSGVLEWQSFSTSQKKVYNIRAKSRGMSGYNLFLRDWLNLHKDVLI